MGLQPDSFVLHVDLWGLPALRSFLQACLQPDALQIVLKLDLLPFQTSFPDFTPLKPCPLNQFAVLVVVHLPSSDLQYILALHCSGIPDIPDSLLGFLLLAGWTLVELGGNHSHWDPNIQFGQ